MLGLLLGALTVIALKGILIAASDGDLYPSTKDCMSKRH